eukprot:tig00000076_g2374.t1
MQEASAAFGAVAPIAPPRANGIPGAGRTLRWRRKKPRPSAAGAGPIDAHTAPQAISDDPPGAGRAPAAQSRWWEADDPLVDASSPAAQPAAETSAEGAARRRTRGRQPVPEYLRQAVDLGPLRFLPASTARLHGAAVSFFVFSAAVTASAPLRASQLERLPPAWARFGRHLSDRFGSADGRSRGPQWAELERFEAEVATGRAALRRRRLEHRVALLRRAAAERWDLPLAEPTSSGKMLDLRELAAQEVLDTADEERLLRALSAPYRWLLRVLPGWGRWALWLLLCRTVEPLASVPFGWLSPFLHGAALPFRLVASLPPFRGLAGALAPLSALSSLPAPAARALEAIAALLAPLRGPEAWSALARAVNLLPRPLLALLWYLLVPCVEPVRLAVHLAQGNDPSLAWSGGRRGQNIPVLIADLLLGCAVAFPLMRATIHLLFHGFVPALSSACAALAPDFAAALEVGRAAAAAAAAAASAEIEALTAIARSNFRFHLPPPQGPVPWVLRWRAAEALLLPPILLAAPLALQEASLLLDVPRLGPLLVSLHAYFVAAAARVPAFLFRGAVHPLALPIETAALLLSAAALASPSVAAAHRRLRDGIGALLAAYERRWPRDRTAAGCTPRPPSPDDIAAAGLRRARGLLAAYSAWRSVAWAATAVALAPRLRALALRVPLEPGVPSAALTWALPLHPLELRAATALGPDLCFRAARAGLAIYAMLALPALFRHVSRPYSEEDARRVAMEPQIAAHRAWREEALRVGDEAAAEEDREGVHPRPRERRAPDVEPPKGGGISISIADLQGRPRDMFGF